MKKAVRYVVIAGCVALFLFLMLPFLVPPSLEKTATANQPEQTAVPQIFTANPLTKILNRIARILKRQPQQPQTSAVKQPIVAGQTARARGLFLPGKKSAYQSEDYFPDNNPLSPDEEPVDITGEPLQENDPDNWVLTRQEAPDRSALGMHEINVKDTPYNRYAKQERLARTSPVTRMDKPAEVPDSKLAKLFRPLTYFWTGKKQVSSPVIASAGPAAQARAIAPADNRLNHYTEKQTRALPKAQTPDLSVPAIKNKSRSSSGLPKYTLTDLINPTSAIRESADLLTQAAYETPGDAPAPNMPSGEFQQIQQETGAQQVADRLRQHLLALSNGAAPEDQIGKTVDCDVTKGLLTEENVCEFPYDENDLATWREANQQEFLARTDIPMPPTQMAFVLGVADKNSLPKMQGDPEEDTPEGSKTKEIYRFMLDRNDCSSNNCYWVANSIQQQKNIPDTFKAAGVDFAGDPLHVYDRIKEDFINNKLAQLPPDASEEQRQEIANQPIESAPPYVPYTLQDMQQLQHQMQQNPEMSMYVSTAADANALANSWSYQAAPFFLGTTSATFHHG